MNGKTVVITGGNAGIGKATATALAKQGANLVLLCRNKQKGEAARQAIIQETENDNVNLVLLDLANLDSVRTAADQLQQLLTHIDVLINNAGGMFSDRKLSSDGYEYTFAMNHLGHFLLTNLVLPQIKAAQTARIINVSSAIHSQGHLNFADLMMEQNYSGLKAYSQAKLANVVFTKSLDQKLRDTHVSSYALHPGVVNTGFGTEAKGFFKFLIGLVRPFMITPEKGAQTSVFLASAPEVHSQSGLYWANKKVRQHNNEADDPDIQERLWRESEELTGLS